MRHGYIYMDYNKCQTLSNGLKCNEWLMRIKHDAKVNFKTLKKAAFVLQERLKTK